MFQIHTSRLLVASEVRSVALASSSSSLCDLVAWVRVVTWEVLEGWVVGRVGWEGWVGWVGDWLMVILELLLFQ